MKKAKYLLATALLLVTTPLLAGLRYEFTESMRTDEATKSTTLSARAVVAGDMSRLEVLGGNRYEPGIYMITHGNDRVYVVNPENKSYLEYETNSRVLNPDRIQVTNLKSEFQEVSDGTPSVVAGYPTKHYRLTMTYDITVRMGSMSIKQNVMTVIDKWMTTAFDEVIEKYRENINELKTGNPEIDTLIETEASKFKGLTLKEHTQIITRVEQKKKNSNVNLPSTRKRTKEMVVSMIEEVQVSPNLFAIPVDYTEGQPTKAPGTTTQYLTMQPDGQQN